jgi:predicted ATPase
MTSKEGVVFSEVSIRNFKSIRQADLELRPLTVLVGENSAGKSSVLQLLFLVSQVARGRTRPDVVSLNGAELNLGNFADVLHSSSAGDQIRLAIRSPLVGSSMRRRLRSRPGIRDRGRAITPAPQFEWRLALDNHPGQLGVAQVSGVEIVDGEHGVRLVVEPNEQQSELEDLFEYSRSLGLVRSLPAGRTRFFAEKSAATRFRGDVEADETLGGGEASESLPAVVLENGFPVELYSYVNESQALSDRWVEQAIRRTVFSEPSWMRQRSLKEIRRERRTMDERRIDPTVLAEQLFPDFRRWVEGLDLGDRELAAMEPLDELTFQGLAGIEDDVALTLTDLLEATRADRGAVAPRSSVTLEVANAFRTLFYESVHYLGPLREDPSPSYRPGQGGGVATLGVKGEFTVAALDMYGTQRIRTPLPGGGEAVMNLKEAVNRWSDAFGLAREISTHDKGRVGLELELLDFQTGESRDLTNVGVGVSQLLPVIVMCLLAQPGELVLLEQPELHLHPAPQQILGDFLLGIIDTGRQVIVETHSEYLVNRLRLRMAEDQYGSVNEAVQLLYANRRDGETRFDALRANRFGSLEDWPEGFFDQAPRESEAILRAAARKRRSKEEPSTLTDQLSSTVLVHVEYQGQRVEALFAPETGTVRILSAPLEGRSFSSPSGAAIAVVRELNPDVSPNRNGWEFWTVSATGETLSSIRE